MDSSQPNIDSSPSALLAERVIAALVTAGIVSETDGESIKTNLASGKLDQAGWKFVLENELERKVCADEQK